MMGVDKHVVPHAGGIHMWPDRETQEDCLGFENYVSTLAAICLEPGLAPLTLGIFGSWGSGKTSLMRMLMNRVSPAGDPRRVKTLWFNAWRYEGKDEAQSALIHAILRKLSEDKGLLADVGDVLSRLKENASVVKLGKFIARSALTMTPDISGFLGCFREQSEKLAESMEQFERDFEELLRKVKVERIIVFIDDLDRCQSGKVIETFETIKLFLNVPQCVFVIGADATKIEQAIGDTYSLGDQDARAFARDYLEKIIQVPFNIPEQQSHDIACYVGMLALRPYLDNDGWPKLLARRQELLSRGDNIGRAFNEWVVQQASLFSGQTEKPLAALRALMPYTGILARGLRGNPRQVKRFLNILSLRRSLASANQLSVDNDVLIKVLVLEYSWPDFFKSVVEIVDPSTGKCELIGEVVDAHTSNIAESPDSSILTQALRTVGLAEFLAGDPQLRDVDMNPYLFLAQTSLGSQHVSVLAPMEEVTARLAGSIADKDRMRSRAGAARAATQDPTIAFGIVRRLIPELIGAEDQVIQANIMSGLLAICRKHVGNYSTVMAALDQVNVVGKTGLALVVTMFFREARKAGLTVSAELEDKVKKTSKIVQALDAPKSAHRSGG
jgi:hypothetical protein